MANSTAITPEPAPSGSIWSRATLLETQTSGTNRSPDGRGGGGVAVRGSDERERRARASVASRPGLQPGGEPLLFSTATAWRRHLIQLTVKLALVSLLQRRPAGCPLELPVRASEPPSQPA